MKKSNYDKFPSVRVNGHTCITGWDNIADRLQAAIDKIEHEKNSYYNIVTNYRQYLQGTALFNTKWFYWILFNYTA